MVAILLLTPPGADIQARTAKLAEAEGVTLLRPGEVPPRLAEALVATEDERFFQHHGIDGLGLIRALLDDVRRGCVCEGGSTLTEQLVKEVYLGDSDRGWNKVVDVAVAFKVELAINKQQILADYLTVTALGYSRYGLVAASCGYFGAAPSGLDLAQEALLAGLPQAPSEYDPTLHPEAARGRRHEVLVRMLAEGYITPEEGRAADAAPVIGSARGGC